MYRPLKNIHLVILFLQILRLRHIGCYVKTLALEKTLISQWTLSLSVKGTVSRDFLLLVLFMNQLPPSPRVFQ
jgi:hypothetical protein